LARQTYSLLISKTAFWVFLSGLLVTLSVGIGLPVLAVPLAAGVSQGEALSAMESFWFGLPYPGESAEARLTRLETMVFGASQQGSESSRLEKLKTIYAQQQAPVMPDTSDDEEDSWVRQLPQAQDASGSQGKPVVQGGSQASAPAPKASSTVVSKAKPSEATPTVSPKLGMIEQIEEMEDRLLGRTYPQESLEARVARLESTLYGSPLVGPVGERVEMLAQRLNGQVPSVASDTNNPNRSNTSGSTYSVPGRSWLPNPNPMGGNVITQPNQAFPPGPGQQAPTQVSPFPNSNTDANSGSASPVLTGSLTAGDLQKLLKLEQKVLKQTYPTLGVDERLNQLEMAVFSQKAPANVAAAQRLARLELVASASKETGVSNRLKQNADLLMFIPMILLMFL
jgi:hypothetical protein